MPLGLEKLSLKGSLKGHSDKQEKENYPPEKQEPQVTAPPAEVLANSNGNGKEAPPSYAPNDPNATDANGPSPAELNAAFANLKLGDVAPEFPTADQCLAHLKLLNAFHALKEDVGYTDGLFGLYDAKCEIVENKEEALAKMREKRWALYIARAVERFEDWWVKYLCTREQSKRITGKEMISGNVAFEQFTERGRVQKWKVEELPPLDVLMVWHAFMLNPRCYLEDCVRFGLKDLWATGIPWPAVNAAIDTSFNYTVPEEGMSMFLAKAGHNWNNAEDSLTKSIYCPRCQQQLEIPWTTCAQSEKTSARDLKDMNGIGYGDRDLSHMCHRCGGEVTHELLRVAKFKKETENLIMKDWPLGGTILNPKTGAPDAPTASLWPSHPDTFPNRLIAIELRAKILELITTNPNRIPTMNDVKELIEKAIQDRSVIKKVNNKSVFESGVMRRPERVAIRKMMSRYWENSSPFALELGGAVIRQSIFVEKMNSLDWLHSPAARETMNRLLLKYSRFIQIIGSFPFNVAIPTLDVDLGWHTHQLSPKSYFNYTVKKCSKFIDHDDKMDEDALSTGFEWTSKTYEKLFQQVYSECTCWYCEAIRSKHISSSAKIFGTSKHEKVLNNFYDSGAAKLCPPDNSAHISAHSAVRVEESATREAVFARLRETRKMQLEDAYKKAVTRARAKGRTIPPRDQYYGAYWGYPYLMYGPYMSMGMYGYGGMYYAGNPCMMPMGAGMAGNCAAGTCGGGVAQGGCGGPGGCGGGMGGCAGGVAGGACSSGGGFGGCGGAGGGGCGGGGCGGGGGGGCGGGGGA